MEDLRRTVNNGACTLTLKDRTRDLYINGVYVDEATGDGKIVRLYTRYGVYKATAYQWLFDKDDANTGDVWAAIIEITR